MTNLLTIKQAASVAGVHYQTIRNWIKSGKLKSRKIADFTVKVEEAELRKLIQGEEV